MYRYSSPITLDSGPSAGRASAGSSAWARRSCTCWRDQYLSVPSAKMIRMLDSPKFDTERRKVIPAMPLTSFSMGIVMSRSTSSAARPGQMVMTSTCTSATSG